jgi:hypothetical protein
VASSGKQEMHTEFWWGDFLENSYFKDRRWEDKINMDLKEVGCKFGRWMELALDRVWQWTLLRELNLLIPLPQSWLTT